MWLQAGREIAEPYAVWGPESKKRQKPMLFGTQPSSQGSALYGDSWADDFRVQRKSCSNMLIRMLESVKNAEPYAVRRSDA